MPEVLGIVLHGMQQDMLRLTHVGMNLANATTPGYQRQVVASQPYQSSSLTPGAVRAGEFANLFDTMGAAAGSPSAVLPAARVFSDTRAGTLKATGQALDLALNAPGYFEVSTPEGPAYTRVGQFHLDTRRRLVNAEGYPVMGVGGEIVLSTANPVVDNQGRIREQDRTVAQLKIVQFDDFSSIERMGNGLMTGEGSVKTVAERDIQIRQGFIENGNVSTMQEMMQLIQLMRHFESMQRVAQGYDDMLGNAIRKLGEL